MRRIRYKDLLARNSHLSYEELVALASDEACLENSEAVRKHLDGCWHCQARHQELKLAIVEIVDNLNAYVGDLSSRSRIAKCRLDQDLARLANEKDNPAPFAQVLATLESTLPSRLLFRQVAIVAVCAVVLLAIFPLTSTAPISAAELLKRSKQAEHEMMENVPKAAIHGMYRVTKKSLGSPNEQSLTWEIWEDTVHNRVRNHVEGEQASGVLSSANHVTRAYFSGTGFSPLLTDLEHVCVVNGIDISHPLSPGGFDSWRQSLNGERDEVFSTRLPAGENGIGLRTIPTHVPAEGRILTAELIMRSGDWHPVEQRFTVQGAKTTQEYDVLETAYQVVALESAPASIFADSDRPLAPPLPSRARLAVIAAPVAPTSQQLDEAEISAKFALYRVDEFLRGQIRIAQDLGGSVQIEGVVETEERKSELTSLLQSIPYTAIKLRTSEEALDDLRSLPELNSTSLLPGDKHFIQPDGDAVKRNQAWVQLQWNQYGKQLSSSGSNGLDEKMAEISNEAIAHTRAASFQAWALRRLAQEYPRERVKGMNEWSKWLLEMMVQDHARLLGVEIGQLNSMTFPVLTSFAASGGAEKNRAAPRPRLPVFLDDAGWQQQVEQIFQNVDDINEQVLGVFGNVDLLRGDAEDAVGDLLRQLPRFKGDVQDFELQVNHEFIGVGESPALSSSLESMPK